MNTKSVCRTAMFAALTALGAYIKIPLPLCPVTMQVMFVVLSGLLLDKKHAVMSGVIYMLAGLIGLPVFTQGGGIGYIANPTFGYIVGFIIGALTASAIVGRKPDAGLKRFFAAAYAGMSVIYIIGTAYFYLICNYVSDLGIGIWAVITSCVLITIPADIVSCFFAAVLAHKLKAHLD